MGWPDLHSLTHRRNDASGVHTGGCQLLPPPPRNLGNTPRVSAPAARLAAPGGRVALAGVRLAAPDVNSWGVISTGGRSAFGTDLGPAVLALSCTLTSLPAFTPASLLCRVWPLHWPLHYQKGSMYD